MRSDDEEGVWIRPPPIAAWYEPSVRDIDVIVPCADDEPWGREGRRESWQICSPLAEWLEVKCRGAVLLYFQLAELAFLLWDYYVLTLDASAGITISTR